MNLQKILLREVNPAEYALTRSLVERIPPSNQGTRENYRYGFIEKPLEYEGFIDVFKDLTLDDFEWLGALGIEYRDSGKTNKKTERVTYLAENVKKIIEGEDKIGKKELLARLKKAEKICLFLRQRDCGVNGERIYFRKNCSSIYSAGIRSRLNHLNLFSFEGFDSSNINFIKADYFPNAQLNVRR